MWISGFWSQHLRLWYLSLGILTEMKIQKNLIGNFLHVGIAALTLSAGCAPSPTTVTNQKPGSMENGRQNARLPLSEIEIKAVREELQIAERDLFNLTNTLAKKVTPEWIERAKTAHNKVYPAAQKQRDLDEQFAILMRRLRSIQAETAVYRQILTIDTSK